MELKEKCFESDIENYLITEGGYEQFSYANPDGHRISVYSEILYKRYSSWLCQRLSQVR